MNQKFEENINYIVKIINKRIYLSITFSIILFILSIVIILIGKENIIIYLITASLFIISFLFMMQKSKLHSLLNTYQSNKRDVVDYLAILIRQYELSKHNFILHIYYKSIIKYYMEAYHALR